MQSFFWGHSCRLLSVETMEEKESILWWWILWSQCSPGQVWPTPRFIFHFEDQPFKQLDFVFIPHDFKQLKIVCQGNTKDEVLANRLLEFLMKHSFHSKRAVFRHNLEIIRTLVECWKDCLHVPYR